MVKALILSACLILAACTTTGGNFCDLNKPQRFTQAEIDALSDAQVNEALRINELGEQLCGWKP